MATTILHASETLTTRQVAALIGRTTKRVGQLARQGRLTPVVEVVGADGRRWRLFSATDVGRYIRERDS